MAPWVRNAVMLIVTVVWAIVVLSSLPKLPDAITWGVPGAVYFALNPTLPRRTAPPGPPERASS